MEDTFESALKAMMQSRRQLSRTKKCLQSRGYDDFIETGDIKLIRQTKQVASHISQLDREIDFIQKNCRETVGLRNVKAPDISRMAEKSYMFKIKGGR